MSTAINHPILRSVMSGRVGFHRRPERGDSCYANAHDEAFYLGSHSRRLPPLMAALAGCAENHSEGVEQSRCDAVEAADYERRARYGMVD